MEWAIAFVVLLLIEIVTVDLVSVWFALGALAAYVTSCFTNHILIQVVVFILVSIVALIFTRPLVKKFGKVSNDAKKMNATRVIGKTGIVTRTIAKDLDGEVKLDGKFWVGIADETLEKGTIVEVKELKGIKLVVQKKEGND